MRSFPLALAIAISVPAAAQQNPLQAIVDAHANAAAPGAARQQYFSGMSSEEDGHTDWNFPLDPANCYWFVGAGGQGVKHLYLYLWNPSEKRVATQKTSQPNVVMSYCPEVPGMFHLQAKTGEGFGAYTVGVFFKPAPPKLAPPPPPPPMDLSTICDGTAAGSAPGAKRNSPLLPGSGDKTDWPIMLDPGTCYWFIGCGEPGKVKGMALFLWGPDGKRVADNKTDVPNPTLGHCVSFPGMYKVQGKVTKGGGAYGVGIYARKMGQ